MHSGSPMVSDSFRWSLHALIETRRRGIALETVEEVVRDAQQSVIMTAAREVRQSIDAAGALVRVIIDVTQDPVVIVTAYRTSKVAKYRRTAP
jgi:hypothetical protein